MSPFRFAAACDSCVTRVTWLKTAASFTEGAHASLTRPEKKRRQTRRRVDGT